MTFSYNRFVSFYERIFKPRVFAISLVFVNMGKVLPVPKLALKPLEIIFIWKSKLYIYNQTEFKLQLTKN